MELLHAGVQIEPCLADFTLAVTKDASAINHDPLSLQLHFHSRDKWRSSRPGNPLGQIVKRWNGPRPSHERGVLGERCSLLSDSVLQGSSRPRAPVRRWEPKVRPIGLERGNPATNTGAFGATLGVGAVVLFPILYGVIGFLGGLLTAALYNLVAGITGGIEFEGVQTNS